MGTCTKFTILIVLTGRMKYEFQNCSVFQAFSTLLNTTRRWTSNICSKLFDFVYNPRCVDLYVHGRAIAQGAALSYRPMDRRSTTRKCATHIVAVRNLCERTNRYMNGVLSEQDRKILRHQSVTRKARCTPSEAVGTAFQNIKPLSLSSRTWATLLLCGGEDGWSSNHVR